MSTRAGMIGILIGLLLWPLPSGLIGTSQAAYLPLPISNEDTAHVDGEGVMRMGCRRTDSPTNSAGSTNDWQTVDCKSGALSVYLTGSDVGTPDACVSGTKTQISINVSTATTTELTPSLSGSGNKYYVCSFVIVTAGANNIALVDDDTDNCASVTSGLAGGTTAATGFNLAANGGLVIGNGAGSVFQTNGTNRVLCLITSATTQASGNMQVVAAP